jgi:hypothetical protein
MFSKGSRYRNLSESVALTAEGERIRGKVLRLIPELESTVRHTVKLGDRLDLLAYKYYGDTAKWWQISDANPERPFPVDLLDTTPLAEERFVLSHADFEGRYARLIVALKNLALKKAGAVRNDTVSYFDSNEPDFESQQIVEPNFLAATVLVTYEPATRAAVLKAIQDHKFHRLGSFSFPQGADLVEIFTIDDPEVKRGWDLLVSELDQTPGVVKVHSSLAERTLVVVYNTDTAAVARPSGRALAARESLLSLIKTQGFDVSVNTTPSSRLGRKINIPPQQVV